MKARKGRNSRTLLKGTLVAVLLLVSPIVSCDGEPMLYKIRMGQTIGAFVAANNLRMSSSDDTRRSAITVVGKEDSMPIFLNEPNSIIRYEDGAFGRDLPIATSVSLGQTGGVITDIDVHVYAEDYTFEKTDRSARLLIDQLLKAGWRAIQLHYPKNAEDKNSTDRNIYYAILMSASGNQLIVSLSPYLNPPEFQMQIDIYAPEEFRERRSEIVAARRFALRGGGDNSSLSLWIEDPDWTPEKLGMKLIEVPNPKWDPNNHLSGNRIFKRWQMPDGTIEPLYR